MAANKKTAKKSVKKTPAHEYVLVRCRDAGVHAGYLVTQTAEHLVLMDARRIWHWTGAASQSELAVFGVSVEKTPQCKIACVVPRVQLRQSDVCEVTLCAAEGKAWLTGAPVWRA